MPRDYTQLDLQDRKLLEEYRRTKSERVLDDLVKRFEPMAWKVVHIVCNRREVTKKDILDDVFVEALVGIQQAIKTFDDAQQAKLSTWCYQYAQGYAFNALASKDTISLVTASETFTNEAAFHSSVDWIEGTRRDAEYIDDYYDTRECGIEREARQEMMRAWKDEERLSLLRKQILQLPQELRSVARLALVQKKTQKVIAEELGICQSNVNKKLRRVEEALANLSQRSPHQAVSGS